MTDNTELTGHEKCVAQMRSRLPDIRALFYGPQSGNDLTIKDDGTLDTVVSYGEETFRYSQDTAADWRDSDGALDLDLLWEDEGDRISDEVRERWHEYGLCFDYVPHGEQGNNGGFFAFVISTGGPHEEIRFFVDCEYRCYRSEFVYKDWGTCDKAELQGKDAEWAQDFFNRLRDCCGDDWLQEKIGTARYWWDN